MFGFLAKKLIKNYGDYSNPEVRDKYGMLSGAVGVFLNILLFVAKISAGLLSGSVSMVADALNNLTDAGSSVITFIGFKLASKPTDREHPFGHGRMEYVTGLIVSMLIFLVGFELIRSSIEKLFSGSDMTFSYPLVIVLGCSILVKLYMFAYNSKTAKKINSAAMRATALDSITDCFATLAVLISVLLNKFFGWQVDGVAGIIVAVFILCTGIKSAKETIGLLVGDAPDPEYVREIEKTVMASPCVLGVHDLMVHNYGPGRQIISLHAEVNADSDILTAHDNIDNVERELEKKFKCIAVIHMDPVVKDERTDRERVAVTQIVKQIDDRYTIHDFRMVEGPTHTNLIFDVVVPPEFKGDESKIVKEISDKVKLVDEKYNVVCQVEKSFTYDE